MPRVNRFSSSPLQDIGFRNKADKAWHLHYLPLYERYLNPIRPSVKRVMELGVKNGGSILMWTEYFPSLSRIIGVDTVGINTTDNRFVGVADRLKQDKRFQLVIADQSDHSLSLHGMFDLIIDDAGHNPTKQKESLELLWPNLNSKGVYCIEDLESSFYHNYHPNAYNNLDCILPYLKSLGDGLHGRYGNSRQLPNTNDPIINECFPELDGLSAIHIHTNIVFLEKM